MMSEADPRPLWNSLERTKIAISALTPLLLFALGVAVNRNAERRDAAAREAEAIRLRAEQKQSAVQEFSRLVYERRVRSELLASSVRRAAPLAELIERKRAYDDVYVRWNANHQANLLLIRRLLAETQYSEFEALIEFHMVRNIFVPLDRCLTLAYDRRLEGRGGAAELDACEASKLIQAALDCGYAFTDELFRLVSSDVPEARTLARTTIQGRCGATS